MSDQYKIFLETIFILGKSRNCFASIENYYKEKIGDIPKPPPENDFWRNYLMKRNFYDLSEDETRIILDTRIKFIENYYDRLFNGQLTEKELHKPKPKNFKGPYLPSPQEIKVISNLDIAIDWNVPHHQYNFINKKHLNQVGELNFFNQEKILNRWRMFQKEYEINDLRPLIGERCGVVHYSLDSGKVEFIFYRLLDRRQYKNFFIYLLKDTPELTLYQILGFLNFVIDNYEDGIPLCGSYGKSKASLSGMEYRLMYEIFDRFGKCLMLKRCVSLFIGKRTTSNYESVICYYGCFRSIPFKDSAWTKTEDLELLKLVKKYSRSQEDLRTFLTAKERSLPWREICCKFKFRTPYILTGRYFQLKQQILDSLTKKELGSEAKLLWTSDQTVQLIEFIYNSEAKCVRDIDWNEMAKNFQGYVGSFISNIFISLIHSRVPPKEKKSFVDSIEYLYHQVKPKYQLNDIKRKVRKNRTEHFLRLESSFSEDEIKNLAAIFENDKNEVIACGEVQKHQESTTPAAQPEQNSNVKKYTSRINTPLDVDDIYWQEMMKEHNFEFHYPLSLQKKLKCVVATGSESEDGNLERPSTSSAGNQSRSEDLVVEANSMKVRFGRRRNEDSTVNKINDYILLDSEDEVEILDELLFEDSRDIECISVSSEYESDYSDNKTEKDAKDLESVESSSESDVEFLECTTVHEKSKRYREHKDFFYKDTSTSEDCDTPHYLKTQEDDDHIEKNINPGINEISESTSQMHKNCKRKYECNPADEILNKVPADLGSITGKKNKSDNQNNEQNISSESHCEDKTTSCDIIDFSNNDYSHSTPLRKQKNHKPGHGNRKKDIIFDKPVDSTDAGVKNYKKKRNTHVNQPMHDVIDINLYSANNKIPKDTPKKHKKRKRFNDKILDANSDGSERTTIKMLKNKKHSDSEDKQIHNIEIHCDNNSICDKSILQTGNELIEITPCKMQKKHQSNDGHRSMSDDYLPFVKKQKKKHKNDYEDNSTRTHVKKHKKNRKSNCEDNDPTKDFFNCVVNKPTCGSIESSSNKETSIRRPVEQRKKGKPHRVYYKDHKTHHNEASPNNLTGNSNNIADSINYSTEETRSNKIINITINHKCDIISVQPKDIQTQTVNNQTNREAIDYISLLSSDEESSVN